MEIFPWHCRESLKNCWDSFHFMRGSYELHTFAAGEVHIMPSLSLSFLAPPFLSPSLVSFRFRNEVSLSLGPLRPAAKRATIHDVHTPSPHLLGLSHTWIATITQPPFLASVRTSRTEAPNDATPAALQLHLECWASSRARLGSPLFCFFSRAV